MASASGERSRARIKDFLSAFWAEHGYSPTVREVAKAVGLGSSTAHHHLLKMVSEGTITCEPGVYRTWRPL